MQNNVDIKLAAFETVMCLPNLFPSSSKVDIEESCELKIEDSQETIAEKRPPSPYRKADRLESGVQQ